MSFFEAISDRTNAKAKMTTGKEQKGKNWESKSNDHDNDDYHECLGIRPAGAENLTEFSSCTQRRATQISSIAFSPLFFPLTLPSFSSQLESPPYVLFICLIFSLSFCCSIRRLLLFYYLQTLMQQYRLRGGWTSSGWHFGSRKDIIAFCWSRQTRVKCKGLTEMILTDNAYFKKLIFLRIRIIIVFL